MFLFTNCNFRKQERKTTINNWESYQVKDQIWPGGCCDKKNDLNKEKIHYYSDQCNDYQFLLFYKQGNKQNNDFIAPDLMNVRIEKFKMFNLYKIRILSATPDSWLISVLEGLKLLTQQDEVF